GARVTRVGTSGDTVHRGSLAIHAGVSDISRTGGIVLVVRDDRVTSCGLAVARSPLCLGRVTVLGPRANAVTRPVCARRVPARAIGQRSERAQREDQRERAGRDRHGSFRRRASEHIEAPHLYAVRSPPIPLLTPDNAAAE